MINRINIINTQFLFLSWINYIVSLLMIAGIQPYHYAAMMPKIFFIASVQLKSFFYQVMLKTAASSLRDSIVQVVFQSPADPFFKLSTMWISGGSKSL